MKKLMAVLVALVFVAGCGTSGDQYVDEGNSICQSAGGVISYSYGSHYDVVVCKDGIAHAINGN